MTSCSQQKGIVRFAEGGAAVDPLLEPVSGEEDESLAGGEERKAPLSPDSRSRDLHTASDPPMLPA